MRIEYFAVYDYGMGGVWAIITAHSKDDITAKYPVLTIFETRPSWMTEQDYDRIASTSCFDIDDEPPNWLVTAMKDNKD